VGRVAEQLAEFVPHNIYGLPSTFVELGRVMSETGISIRPRRLFTGGELLTARSREDVIQAFGCPVFDVYGTSETKEIAFECPRGGLHINDDVVRLEVLDDAGGPVPTEDEGNLVATLLVNRAMPILRYVTGDRGRLHGARCGCGLTTPLMAMLEGRKADVLELEHGLRVSPYVMTMALERIPGVRRFQVVQRGPSLVVVRVLRDASVSESSIADRVRTAVREATTPDLRVTVDFVTGFPRGGRGKFHVVQGMRRESTPVAREP
jgi:phenylacetate-CoA ligase